MDFKEFYEEKKVETIIIVILVLNMILTLSIKLSGNKSIVFVDEATESAKPNLEKFCSVVTKQMISKSLNKRLFLKEIHEELTKNNHKVLDLSGKEEFYFAKAGEKGCEIAWSDEFGIRPFKLEVLETNEIDSIKYIVAGIKSI